MAQKKQMKKYFSLIAAVLMLGTAATFTSCNKDDDDEIPSGYEYAEGGYKYVEPCLQWGAAQDQVASWMNSHTTGFKLNTQDDRTMLYTLESPFTQITYMFNIGDPGLCDILVTYFSTKGLSDIISKIEKTYSCKLTPEPDEPNDYSAYDVMVNGRRTNITVVARYGTGGYGTVVVNYDLD